MSMDDTDENEDEAEKEDDTERGAPPGGNKQRCGKMGNSRER
jgi:hypothetical protein